MTSTVRMTAESTQVVSHDYLASLILTVSAALIFIGPLVGSLSFGGVSLAVLTGGVSMMGATAAAFLAVISDSATSDRVGHLLKAGLGLLVLPATLTVASLSAVLSLAQVATLIAMPMFMAVTIASFAGSASFSQVRARALYAYLFAGGIHLLFWAASGLPARFIGAASSKNVVGGLSLGVTLLVLQRGARPLYRTEVVTLVVAILVAYSASSRASVLVSLLAVIGLRRNHMWKWLLDRRAVFLGLLCALFVPIIYMNLWRVPGFDVLDDFLLRVSGTGVYTGRQSLWADSIQAAREQLLLGNGIPFRRTFTSKTLHSHNMFLDRLNQSGLIGMLGMCWYLINLTSQRAALRTASLTAAALFFVLLQQTFEVNFGSGGLPVGLVLYAVVGLAIARDHVAEVGGDAQS